jgi:uncharacterized protein
MNALLKNRNLIVFAVLCVILFSCTESGEKNDTKKPSQAYIKEIETWDAKRVVDLKAEDGWLNVAGRYWLAPGKNTVGADPDNMIVFPVEKAPLNIGYITVEDSTVSFAVSRGVTILDENKKPFTSGIIFDNHSGEEGKKLSYGTLKWFVIKRSNRYVLRLRDFESEGLKNFSHIDRFPVDETWRIEADFEPAGENKNMVFDNVIGTKTEMPFMGTLRFERDGKKYELRTVLDEDLFIVFADSTTGKETYHTGRFLHASIPKNGEKVILDFNKAYNPPCAFTDYATCPLPPKENILPVRIEAGEKKYGH